MPLRNRNLPCQCRKEHKCGLCSKGFQDPLSLVAHLKDRGDHKREDFPFQCSTCPKQFLGTDAFVKHLKKSKIHKYDLHRAACCGIYQDVNKLMYSEDADKPGVSHDISRPATLNTYYNYNEPHPIQIGDTPMHCATYHGNSRCLKIMLAWSDGDPNVRDRFDGETPVHIAAAMGFTRCLELLLQHHGDPFIKDNCEKTPLDVATDSCRQLICVHMIKIDILGSACTGSAQENEEMYFLRQSLSRSCSTTSYDGELETEGADLQDVQGPENQTVLTDNQTILTEDHCTTPVDILARGELAVETFKNALKNGKAPASHLKLQILGDPDAGKSSLVRSLSGEPFQEERTETHGIATNMVETVQLNTSWRPVKLDASTKHHHTDQIISRVVSKEVKNFLRRSLEIPSLESPSLPAVEGQHEDGDMVLASSWPPHHNYTPVVDPSVDRADITGANRKMPCNDIAKNLQKEEKYIKISIWDFAGHKLYLPMHHMFLNKRSIYIVVFNLVCFKESVQETLESIHFWLNSVRAHTPSATPIFLVGTRSQSVSPEDIESANNAIKARFGDAFSVQLVRDKESRHFFPIDNSLGNESEGIKEIQRCIEQEAHQLKFVHEELPISWMDYEEKLFELREKDPETQYITKEEVKKLIIKTNGSISDMELAQMLLFFHDSGVIILLDALMGPAERLPDLHKYVILNPQYFVDIMTKVCDIQKDTIGRAQEKSLKKLTESGVADLPLLKHLWSTFGNRTGLIIDMLQAVNMICPCEPEHPLSAPSISNESPVHQYIIPCHLPKRDLQRKWRKWCEEKNWPICQEESQLIFDFGSFLPDPLFFQFLIHLKQECGNRMGIPSCMSRRSGIFSYGQDHYFFVEHNRRHCQIRIHIRWKANASLPDFFKNVQDIMTQICKRNFSYLKFKCGPVCPLPDCPGVTHDGNPVVVDYVDSDDEVEGVQEVNEQLRRRVHVIPLSPSNPVSHIYCNITRDLVHDYDDIKRWALLKREASLESTLSNPMLSSVLVRECCLTKINLFIGNTWAQLCRMLNVQSYSIEEIESRHEQQQDHCFNGLLCWVQSNGDAATAAVLLKTLMECGRRDIAEKLSEHIQSDHKSNHEG